MIEATEEEKKIVEFHFNIDLSRGIIDKKYNLVTRDNRQVASKLWQTKFLELIREGTRDFYRQILYRRNHRRHDFNI